MGALQGGQGGLWGVRASVLQQGHFMQVRSQHLGSFYVVIPNEKEGVVVWAGVPGSRRTWGREHPGQLAYTSGTCVSSVASVRPPQPHPRGPVLA